MPNRTKDNPAEVAIIPKPVRMENLGGSFSLDVSTRIEFETGAEATREVALYLSDLLSAFTGRSIPMAVIQHGGERRTNTISLTTAGPLADLGEAGYELSVLPDSVSLRASQAAGLFYGVQTLRQLLPVWVEKREPNPDASLELPCVRIEDRPRFAWRGLMLDCVRHFMTKDFILRMIDLLAYHKLNVLHLHLVDDQGWRIEIEKYPKLTEVGAWRDENGGRYGGFYTQDELREIVAYAASRHVLVVPEIEMPGHATAAIASYPDLACDGEPIPVATEWEIFKNVLCGGKEFTFEFLENVLTEVLDIFPSPFIHIGGDEAERGNWENCELCQERIQRENLKNEHELQSYMVRRIGRFLTAHGRRLIGWDEILFGGGLPETAVVQSWRDFEGTVSACKMGMDTVCSPCSHVYFDYPHTEDPRKPDWMRLTPVEKVYSFEPIPEGVNPEAARHILGSQCCVWTEHLLQETLDPHVFPRLCALSEVVWSPAETREWSDFEKRLESHFERLDALGVDSYRG